jgi:hypothetical protein
MMADERDLEAGLPNALDAIDSLRQRDEIAWSIVA